MGTSSKPAKLVFAASVAYSTEFTQAQSNYQLYLVEGNAFVLFYQALNRQDINLIAILELSVDNNGINSSKVTTDLPSSLGISGGSFMSCQDFR